MRDDRGVVSALFRTYRLRGLIQRVLYEVQVRSSALSAGKSAGPDKPIGLSLKLDSPRIDRWVQENPSLRDHAEHRARTILGGKMSLYGGRDYDVGWPPDWNRHPSTGHEYPSLDWSKLSHTGEFGDVKDPWTMGRFSWTGVLLRAHTFSGDNEYLKSLADAISSFRDQCPPDLGVQWMNGQEIAIRGMNLLLVWGLLPAEFQSTTLKCEVEELLRTSSVHVLRTLRYAASQRNNHLITEAVFLWVVAVTCPQIPNRDVLIRRASRAIVQAVSDQFLPDGSHTQYSFTYLRHSLHAMLFVHRVSVATNTRFPIDLQPFFRRSHRLFQCLIDVETGRVPNLGANDGTLIFDFTGQPIHDFRPLLTHLALAGGVEPSIGSGPWDEEAAWFGYDVGTGRDPSPPEPSVVPTAFHTAKGVRTFLLFRAGRLSHRPSQADQLHVDIWIDHANVARDLGTFRYSTLDSWSNALSADEVHNLARPRDTTQARRRGRFFWLDWPQAEVLRTHHADDLDVFLAQVPYVKKHSFARRLVVRHFDTISVADYVNPAPGVVRWNLPLESSVHSDDIDAIVNGDGWWARVSGSPSSAKLLTRSPDDPSSGWESITYGEISPVNALVVKADTKGMALSTFGPDQAEPPTEKQVAQMRRAVEFPSASTWHELITSFRC